MFASSSFAPVLIVSSVRIKRDEKGMKKENMNEKKRKKKIDRERQREKKERD